MITVIGRLTYNEGLAERILLGLFRNRSTWNRLCSCSFGTCSWNKENAALQGKMNGIQFVQNRKICVRLGRFSIKV